jgi:hypothetical protein
MQSEWPMPSEQAGEKENIKKESNGGGKLFERMGERAWFELTGGL